MEDFKDDAMPEELRVPVFFAEDDEVLNTAKKFFHVSYLFPWQRLVISNILESFEAVCSGEAQKLNDLSGGDSDVSDAFCLGRQIVLLPTGAGKSMCFLVPALMLPGATLIIYPLLSLMSDQKRRMTDADIESVVFCGGQTDREREENFSKIKNGVKIILANPEVLQNKTLVEKLKECRISHIAIDEAHCVSEWGDGFRPAYLTLGKIIQELNAPVVTAFTATASPSVLSRVSEILFDGNAHIVRSESDRPNIRYFVKYAYSKTKALFELCRTQPRPILVFCGTRKKAEDTARDLGAYFDRDDVRFYHAGMTKEEKSAVEKWFFPHKNAVLCATCAFGMGVDKPDIRTVIHLEPSLTAESYIQEAGRGGRDRETADAILLWNYDDSVRFGSDESPRVRVMKEFAESGRCRRQVLLDALGAEQAVCSGCDVCLDKMNKTPGSVNGNKKSLFGAEDRNTALRFISRRRKLYSKREMIPKLKDCFNERSRRTFGENVWTENDVKCIVRQLEAEQTVKTHRWPWSGKIGVDTALLKKMR